MFENYTIRELKRSEIPLLDDMLYAAIFQREGAEPLPREVIRQPEISVYIDGFGKPDDYCLVAEYEGKIIGAVWARILCGAVKGYGNIDDKTPEFAISLFKEYRNRGVGTALMREMITYLKEKGYSKTSLSVQKDNYAAEMYKKLGFEIVKENENDYLMLLKL